MSSNYFFHLDILFTEKSLLISVRSRNFTKSAVFESKYRSEDRKESGLNYLGEKNCRENSVDKSKVIILHKSMYIVFLRTMKAPDKNE